MSAVPCVLIIDDDEAIRDTLHDLLKLEGYSVLLAGDGESGVALLDNHPEIEIVLLDLMLPTMHGEEAMKLIRERRSDLPIVIITANHAWRMPSGLLPPGDVLMKPFEADRLLQIVERFLT